MSRIYIGLMGLGEVGSNVARILRDCAERIRQKAGIQICIKRAFVRHIDRYETFDFPITDQIDDLLEDEEISIIVELIGGIDYPFEIAKRVFQKKKAFVTANKAMLAYYAEDLKEYSSGIPFGFEASVCGGMPVVEILKDGLVANDLVKFVGILNGTSHFILTKMLQSRCDFDSALGDAQKLGYAESDPSLDIDGKDAGHKLLILARLAYGIQAKPEDILIEGIRGIEWDDLDFADRLGYVIKPLAIAKKNQNFLDLRVHLALIPKDHVLSQIDGVKNGIYFQGDCVGDLFISGLGAGGSTTASAVIADLVRIVRMKESQSYPAFGFFDLQAQMMFLPKEKLTAPYYLRFMISSDINLEEIIGALSDRGIIVHQAFQKDLGEYKKVFITTSQSSELSIDSALKHLENLIIGIPYKVRIYDE